MCGGCVWYAQQLNADSPCPHALHPCPLYAPTPHSSLPSPPMLPPTHHHNIMCPPHAANAPPHITNTSNAPSPRPQAGPYHHHIT